MSVNNGAYSAGNEDRVPCMLEGSFLLNVMTEDAMRTYGSFLIRCWLTGDPPEDAQLVFTVEHIQTGKHTRVDRLSEVQDWIVSACRAARRESNEFERGDAVKG